jgi:Taurine catabolism dioxygenase TauD, TfdA family
MTDVLQSLEPRCEWTAADVQDDSSFTVALDDDDCDELDRALRHALATGRDLLDLTAADFPLERVAARLEAVSNELLNGRGFVRLRGIDRDAYTQAEMELLYWGIGLHLGIPWEQNKHGHVLGDVTDQGAERDDPTTRGNEIGGLALPFHCDGSDLVGLLCLSNGRSGGRSVVAGSVAIHNRLVVERPEVAATLYERYPYDLRGEEAPGARPWYAMPVSAASGGRLFVRCIPTYIASSQRHASAPRLTTAQLEALAVFIGLAEEPEHHVEMDLLPGDMQFINNHHVLHGRTAYEDVRATGSVRHLKRLWLESPALTDRPRHLTRPVRSHWAEKRSVSRLQIS